MHQRTCEDAVSSIQANPGSREGLPFLQSRQTAHRLVYNLAPNSFQVKARGEAVHIAMLQVGLVIQKLAH